jgi:hypothetical protein
VLDTSYDTSNNCNQKCKHIDGEKNCKNPFGGTCLFVIVSMGNQEVSNKTKIVCEGCKVKFDSEKEFKEHSLKTGHTVWAKEERKGW